MQIGTTLMGFADLNDFQSAHKKWIEASFLTGASERQGDWSQSIAVGSQSFIEKVNNRLGFKAKGRTITGNDDHYQLRENISDFGHASRQGFGYDTGADDAKLNGFFWQDNS